MFDALIGNNDRHFYNWGIVHSILNKRPPVFSPFYDTARGLFWNDHEPKVKNIVANKTGLPVFIERYCNRSNPKIGWEEKKNINHFELIQLIGSSSLSGFNKNEISSYCTQDKLIAILKMIDTEFYELMSYERRFLIKECLRFRFKTINQILDDNCD
ncbi:MAG: hypothetical protein K9H64_09915 [Bacteroidales bacterium]|nr:hypothetical protein [Bacteroidales bacterium]MCF8456183.1 hypothetical protein [Bacteroidales bacterium]